MGERGEYSNSGRNIPGQTISLRNARHPERYSEVRYRPDHTINRESFLEINVRS